MWKRLSGVLRPWSKRQSRLMLQRKTYDIGDFVRYFESDPTIAEALWEALAREAEVEGFKPAPGDDLVYVFGLADEDLDDVVVKLLQRCGCRVPPPAETANMAPIRTVADLYSFLEQMKPADPSRYDDPAAP